MGLKLIGIAGKAQSGKDTFANTLVEEHGFAKLPMAGALKVSSSSLMGFPQALVFDDEFKKFFDPYWEMTVREAFQRIGDAMKNEFGEDFWARRWMYAFHTVSKTHSVVVPDIRFEEEAEMLRALGGVIVHISRDGAGLEGKLGQHRSEAGIKKGSRDIGIENNAGLSELAHQAFNLVAFIEEHAEEYNLRNEWLTT